MDSQPTHEQDDHGTHRGVPSGPTMHVVYVCALAAVVMGLYFGMRYEEEPGLPSLGSESGYTPVVKSGVVASIAYEEIERGNLGPNANITTRVMPPDQPSTAEEATLSVAPEQILADLSARAERRAFDGAPPAIPHRIDPRDVTSCLVCHGPNGMTVGDVVAPPIPHESYVSCTQCHAPTRSVHVDESRWMDNSFAGRPAPSRGHRASPGAPPVIPHSTLLRTNCTSCHGSLGAPGLRSTHPWRRSCTQCHAPSADLDRHPGANTGEPLFLPATSEPHDDGDD